MPTVHGTLALRVRLLRVLVSLLDSDMLPAYSHCCFVGGPSQSWWRGQRRSQHYHATASFRAEGLRMMFSLRMLAGLMSFWTSSAASSTTRGPPSPLALLFVPRQLHYFLLDCFSAKQTAVAHHAEWLWSCSMRRHDMTNYRGIGLSEPY